MNYWTNIHIPQRFSTVKQQVDAIQELAFKLEMKEKECGQLYKELENIFEALKSGNVVSVTYEKETIKAKIVEDIPY
jgi:hypothetical protein